MEKESLNNLMNCLDEETEKLLEHIAQERGFYHYKIEKNPGSVKGDGYLGTITAIRITGIDEYKKKKVLNLVLKSAPKNEVLRGKVPVSEAFQREIYMYKTVMPAFRKFQVEKGLRPFSSIAKCYGACFVDKSEALVFENLKEKGYSLWERRIPMEHDHVSFVMKEFGRFHALSFALRDQKPKLFHKLTCNVYDIFQTFIEKCQWIELYSLQSIKALDSLDSADNEVRKVFGYFIDYDQSIFLQKLHKLVDDYSVILHGDVWTNNLFFKYEIKSEPTKPTKMCFIDLQMARLGPAALDLSYFLYSCSSAKVLSNVKHYLNVYYSSLSAYLQQLGSNPKKVYPYSVFRKEWKENAKFGLICSTYIIRAMLSEEDEVIEFDDFAESRISIADACNKDINNEKEFKDRMRPIILHFVNNKFI